MKACIAQVGGEGQGNAHHFLKRIEQFIFSLVFVFSTDCRAGNIARKDYAHDFQDML